MNAGNFSNSSADMRLAELSVSSRLGPAARAFSIIEFLSEGEVEVPEAVVVFDDLGDGLELRAGRMLMDVGKWNTVHVHDLPTPFGDPVRANLFGGGLSGTGLEIHRWQVWGENPVRYSLGLWTQAEAHGHLQEDEEEGHDEHEHEHGGGWNIEKPFLSGRVTSQLDFGQNGWWQWGLSYFGSPNGLSQDWELEDESLEGTANGLLTSTLGFDLSLKTSSLSDQSWNALGLEIWRHSQGMAHAEGAGGVLTDLERESHRPMGAWLRAEHGFSPQWSIGAHYGWWQEGEELHDASRGGLMLNRHFSENNRLRFAVEQLQEDGEDSIQATVQWTGFLGKHRHGLEW
ncbi:MAG: hypothetical protein MK213_02135 [Planctomycetes bacterium]|nr:hypothetical protein [Planctomycetota bacterium]